MLQITALRVSLLAIAVLSPRRAVYTRWVRVGGAHTPAFAIPMKTGSSKQSALSTRRAERRWSLSCAARNYRSTATSLVILIAVLIFSTRQLDVSVGKADDRKYSQWDITCAVNVNQDFR